MDLFLLRHAEAGEAPRDEDRELTDRGHKQAQSVAAGLDWLNLNLTAILSSPLPRSVQTAQPVADKLSLKVETTDALATGHDAQDALALLAGHGDGILLVGHEPQLSGIVQAVTGGHVHMRKAMVAHIELDSTNPAEGALAWLLSWRCLQRLGHG